MILLYIGLVALMYYLVSRFVFIDSRSTYDILICLLILCVLYVCLI